MYRLKITFEVEVYLIDRGDARLVRKKSQPKLTLSKISRIFHLVVNDNYLLFVRNYARSCVRLL